jgi:O-antigen/teichoic acid export membrane protein
MTAIKSREQIIKAIAGIWAADSLRGRFARGAIWSFIGALLAQGSSLAASVLAARLLGREQFGRYGMIQGTIGMLGTFAGMGLGVTTTKYVAEFRARDPERAGRIIALGWIVAILFSGILALGLFIYAPLLAGRTLNDPSLASGLRIGCALLFLNAFNGAQFGAFSGFEAFRTVARINLARGLIGLPLTVAGVYFWQIDGGIWALVIAAAITCVVSQISLRAKCAAFGIFPRLSTGWLERRVLWTFSTPAFLSGVLVGPAIWAANTMLVNQPNGYAEMGILSAATQWRNAIGFIPGVLGQFALPLLANLNGEQDVYRYGRALRLNLVLTVVAAALVATPIALGSSQIMRLYGRSFQSGAWVLVISAATGVISSVNAVVGTAILSSRSVWVGFTFNAMWATLFLVCSYFFIPTHRALGLASALLVAYVAHATWESIYLRRQLSHV